MTFVRGMGGFYVRIQYVSTSCLRYGAPIQQLTSGCSMVLFRIKRFRGTKHFAVFIWFHLKRFRGTKLPEDCPLWPARMRWKGSPQRGVPVRMVRPAGVHGILPFHIICLISMFSRGTAKLMKQHKIRKVASSFAKPCHYKACRHLQRRFWYSHRDSNPNRQNRNLKSYPLDYGSKRGQEQMPPCGIDFPYLRCKVNYFND